MSCVCWDVGFQRVHGTYLRLRARRPANADRAWIASPLTSSFDPGPGSWDKRHGQMWKHRRHKHCLAASHGTLIQCCITVGPASPTLDQHLYNIEWPSSLSSLLLILIYFLTFVLFKICSSSHQKIINIITHHCIMSSFKDNRCLGVAGHFRIDRIFKEKWEQPWLSENWRRLIYFSRSLRPRYHSITSHDAQHTRDIQPILVKCWSIVCDAGRTLNQN